MSVLRMPPRIPAPRNPQLDFKQRNPAKPFRFLPPNNGLNLKDALSNMKQGDALRLDNLIAQPDGVSTRNGRDIWTPAMGARVESLMEYASPGQEFLFAAVGGQIKNVTAAGAPLSPTVPGAPFASNQWSHAQILSAAGTFLACCNGVSPPLKFDPVSGWQAHSMTFAANPTIINSFIHVSSHIGRLWFTPKDSASVFYLAPASIGGALTEFPINLRLGGYIMCTAALTRDGGLGSDDLFAIISSKGEVLTYAGTNPASVNTWGLVGAYTIPPPVSRRCTAKMGADLAVLTTRGLSPMAEVMRLASVMQSKATLTDRINSELGYEWDGNWDEFGWELHEHPGKNLVVVNVPISATESLPFVMHAETGGWCRWTNYNALCFASFQGKLYCGDDAGRVWFYSTSYTDEDTPITCEVMSCFDMMGSPGVKTVSAVKPTFKGPSARDLPVEIFTDYDTDKTIINTGVIDIHGPPWNVTSWNTTKWGPSNQSVGIWQVSMGSGVSIAVGMKFTTNDNVTITGIDVLYEEGPPL